LAVVAEPALSAAEWACRLHSDVEVAAEHPAFALATARQAAASTGETPPGLIAAVFA